MDPNFTTPIQRIQTIAQFYFILISKKFDCLSRVRDRRLRKFNVMITSIFRDDRLSGEFCHPLHHWKYHKFTPVQNYIKINSEKLKLFTLPQSRAPCVFLLIPTLSLSIKFVRARTKRRNVVVLRLFVSMSSLWKFWVKFTTTWYGSYGRTPTIWLIWTISYGPYHMRPWLTSYMKEYGMAASDHFLALEWSIFNMWKLLGNGTNVSKYAICFACSAIV